MATNHALTKCANCGKSDLEHNTITRGCPVGRKHRTFGWMDFHRVNKWLPKVPKRKKQPA